MLIGFAGVVLLWALVTTTVLLFGGHGLVTRRLTDPTAAVEDGFWHLGTTALLAAAAQRRRLMILAPFASLAFDLDHLPGFLGYFAVARPDHSLSFLAVATIAIVLWQGVRSGAAVAGAVISHLGLDGGAFPLLAPASPTLFHVAFAGQVALVAIGALLLFGSARPYSALRRVWCAVPLLLAVGLMAGLLYFVWPVLGIFSHN